MPTECCPRVSPRHRGMEPNPEYSGPMVAWPLHQPARDPSNQDSSPSTAGVASVQPGKWKQRAFGSEVDRGKAQLARRENPVPHREFSARPLALLLLFRRSRAEKFG